jgi:geranylgeranyl reductase family protein
MESYDVVIVGAGPAGLKCAEALGGTGLSVLVLEKRNTIGQKTCAGGLTVLNKNFHLPFDMTLTFREYLIILNGKEHVLASAHPIHTIDRVDLGQYQLGLVRRHENITIRTDTAVRDITDTNILTDGGNKIAYRYLVGADGATSIVRKYLGLENRLYMGMHYVIPEVHEKMVWIFHPGLLGSGYGWIFPHRSYTSAGVYFNPNRISPQKAREALNELLDDYGIDYRNARFAAAPVNCLYRGIKFGNIFLVGDAAGLVSAGTGEGIAYALTSGEDVARHLLDTDYDFDNIRKILTYKKRQEFILSVFDRLPILQTFLFRVFGKLIKKPRFQKFYGGDI